MALTDDQVRAEMRQRIESFCRERGYRTSAFLDAALEDFVRMYHIYGDMYCPCQVEQWPETICVCAAVRQGLVDVDGACFCGLIVLPTASSQP